MEKGVIVRDFKTERLRITQGGGRTGIWATS
jgi:hypothetical protein